MWSWSAVRAFVPAASCPGSPDLAAHGADGVGEIEEGVDDGDVTLVTAGETVKGVLPGVGAFDVPTPTSPKGRLRPLVRNVSTQAAFAEQNGGLVQVVAGVQVHGDAVAQRAEVVQSVQGRGRAGGNRGGWHRTGHAPRECRIRPSCPSV